MNLPYFNNMIFSVRHFLEVFEALVKDIKRVEKNYNGAAKLPLTTV